MVLAEERLSMSPPRLRDRVSLQVAVLKEATDVIVRNHYLHRGRTMAQLPYWITFDGERRGVLLFSLPRMSAQFQGHRPMSLIELARMWIDPCIQGDTVVDSEGREHSLTVATCAVGKALRQVRQDWFGKYPQLPEITACVSWADDVHHEGTIYRAANFREIGKSGGALHGNTHRRNGGRDQLNADYLHPKTAFLYEYKRRLSDSQRQNALRIWKFIHPPAVRGTVQRRRVDARQLALLDREPA